MGRPRGGLVPGRRLRPTWYVPKGTRNPSCDSFLCADQALFDAPIQSLRLEPRHTRALRHSGAARHPIAPHSRNDLLHRVVRRHGGALTSHTARADVEAAESFIEHPHCCLMTRQTYIEGCSGSLGVRRRNRPFSKSLHVRLLGGARQRSRSLRQAVPVAGPVPASSTGARDRREGDRSSRR